MKLMSLIISDLSIDRNFLKYINRNTQQTQNKRYFKNQFKKLLFYYYYVFKVCKMYSFHFVFSFYIFSIEFSFLLPDSGKSGFRVSSFLPFFFFSFRLFIRIMNMRGHMEMSGRRQNHCISCLEGKITLASAGMTQIHCHMAVSVLPGRLFC